MELSRSAGILLHPTSLPSGKLDREAYRFVDWLAAAGQSWWQVLPLGPPDEFGSPYRSPSAFAASPQLLARPKERVTAAEVEDFVARHPFWTGGWAHFAGSEALADEVRFEREWSALRAYAAERGVRLIGDVPIYVSDGGADHDCWPELFAAGEVAGAPPDSAQCDRPAVGKPALRLARPSGDRLPLVARAVPPHVRARRPLAHRPLPGLRLLLGDPGAELDGEERALAAWPRRRAVPRRRARARPSAADRGGSRPHHAAGLRAPRRARAARDGRPSLGVPPRQAQPAQPSQSPAQLGRVHEHPRHRHRRRLVRRAARRAERDATGLDPREPNWGLIELAYSSRAELAVVPAQDVLGLGSDARMNRPGRTGGNWRWQLERGALTPALARRLRGLAEQYDRSARPQRLRRSS